MSGIADEVAKTMKGGERSAMQRALGRRGRRVRISAEGSGGYEDQRGANVISGGGQISAHLPLPNGATLSPYYGGGGAYGSVKTPHGNEKIRDSEKPSYGVKLRIPF